MRKPTNHFALSCLEIAHGCRKFTRNGLKVPPRAKTCRLESISRNTKRAPANRPCTVCALMMAFCRLF